MQHYVGQHKLNFNREISHSGSAFEMGFEQGKRFAKSIKEGWEILKNFGGIIAAKPPFIPTPIFLLAAGIYARWFLSPTMETFPDFSERFLGILKGANISQWKLALLHLIEVIGSDAARQLMGCSSIAVVPPKSDEPILAKNFDFVNEFQPFGIMRINMPRWDIPGAEFTLSAIAGSHTGMNKEGLAITYNYGYSREKAVREILLTAKVQQIIQKCRTVDEAMKYFSRKPHSSAGIITIMDASGKCYAVEISPQYAAIVEPKDGFLVNANLYAHPAMQRRMIPLGAKFGEKAPQNIRGKKIQYDNIMRTKRLQKLMESYDKIDIEVIKKILADHGEDNKPDEDTICRHHDSFGTHLSVIMLPAQKKMLYLWGKPCSGEWKEFKL